MPVYEFYCSRCHRIYNFLSRRVETERRPACPICGKPDLEREVSLFAVVKPRPDSEEGPLPDVDEARMEKAVEALAREADGLDEDDPKQAARLMRRLYDAAGLRLGPGMEEAIRRMEAGEDPDKVEQELGDLLEEDPLFEAGSGGLRDMGRRLRPPVVDDTLYEL